MARRASSRTFGGSDAYLKFDAWRFATTHRRGTIRGRVIVPLISLGSWRCEPLLSDVPKRETRLGGLFHYRSGRIYFTSEGTAAIGALFCFLAVGGGVLIWYLRRG
jgi:hypothetical protein